MFLVYTVSFPCTYYGKSTKSSQLMGCIPYQLLQLRVLEFTQGSFLSAHFSSVPLIDWLIDSFIHSSFSPRENISFFRYCPKQLQTTSFKFPRVAKYFLCLLEFFRICTCLPWPTKRKTKKKQDVYLWFRYFVAAIAPSILGQIGWLSTQKIWKIQEISMEEISLREN